MSEYTIIGGDGREYGPVPLEQLRRWVREGRVNSLTQVRVDAGAWQRLSQLPGFGDTPAPMPLSAPPRIVPSLDAPVQVPTPQEPQPTGHTMPGIKPETYLLPSIFATLFCFAPVGIVAIIYASRVEVLFKNRQYDEAFAYAAKARAWCWRAVMCLFAIIAIVLVGFTARVFG